MTSKPSVGDAVRVTIEGRVDAIDKGHLFSTARIEDGEGWFHDICYNGSAIKVVKDTPRPGDVWKVDDKTWFAYDNPYSFASYGVGIGGSLYLLSNVGDSLDIKAFARMYPDAKLIHRP